MENKDRNIDGEIEKEIEEIEKVFEIEVAEVGSLTVGCGQGMTLICC